MFIRRLSLKYPYETFDIQSLFVLAVGTDRTDTVQVLKEIGADLNIRYNYGRTALMLAAVEGYTKTVEALEGAALGIKDNYGNTALMLATMYGKTRTVQALIKMGADLNIQDIFGKSALMLAGCIEIVKELKEAQFRQ